MAGVKHTTPADGTFSPAGAVAWDEEHTLSDVASQAALDTLSNAVSVADAALSLRITSVAGLGGGGSVTSAEVNAVSVAAASADATLQAAINVVSNAASNALSVANAVSARAETISNAVSVVSVAAANALSVANAVSARADTISNAVSALSNTNSANHVSINGRIDTVSNAVSVVSVAAANALSVANAASNKASALSVVIAANSAQMTSADNALSQALSVLSNTNSSEHAALSARITSVAGLGGGGSVTSAEVFNAISSLADRVSANSGVGGGGSVTSAEVNAVSVAAQSAINTQSARIDTVSNGLSVLSQALSVLSQQNSVEHAALSARITSVAGAGGGSVTSAEVNAVSVAAASADNTLSLRIDSAITANANNASVASQAASVASAAAVAANSAANTASNYASVASNAASVAVQAASVASAAALAAGAPLLRALSAQKSVAGSALVDLSGMVLTVATGERWQIEGMAAFSTSATTVGLRLGYSVPPLSTPRFGYFNRISGGQSGGAGAGAGLLQISGSSVFMSITGVGPAGGVFVVEWQHVMDVASAGTIRLQWAGVASTTASPMHILPGSYMRCVRLK